MDIDWDKVGKDIATFGIKIYPLEECIIGDCLGSGSAMEVFEGKCNIYSVVRNVTFKRHMKFKGPTLEQKDVNKILQDFRHEITLMRRLNYPITIAKIYGITFEERKPVFIVEGDKTLDRYLLSKARSSTPATWCEKIKLCKDISGGVRCLHDAGIIHGDIIGENVLVLIESTGVTTAKLSGFGHSSALNSSDGDTGGNKIFMAPETRGIEELKEWEEKPTQDIFNFGLVIHQIANDGKTPHEDPEETLKADSTNRHTEALLVKLRHDTPEVFRILIRSTTRYMPTERASLYIIEKIIYDFQKASSKQVNPANNTLLCLESYTESSRSRLPPSVFKIIPRYLANSKQFCPDGLKNNSKKAEWERNEIKRESQNFQKINQFLSRGFYDGKGLFSKNKKDKFILRYILRNGDYEKKKVSLESRAQYDCILDIYKLPISPSFKSYIFYEYQQLAETGDIFALFMLGVCWQNGLGTEMNDLKAIECFTKAAEAGSAPAQNILGVFYDSGRGVIKNMSKAIKLYTMAAEAGYPKALYNLGLAHKYGKGMTVDYIKAVELFTKATEANCYLAQLELGLCYEYGEGVTKDMVKAVKLYKKAAEGAPSAQNHLGILYEDGCGVKKDLARAFEFYTKAAKAGNPEAQCNLGLCYEYGKSVTKDIKKAAEWYIKAAKADITSAQNKLGYFYEKGIGGFTKDHAKAFEWYKKGAEGGDDWAQYNLGRCYQYGHGVRKNEFKAVEWYTKSVEADNASAHNDLAFCYENGIGVIKDYVKAIELYTKAAKAKIDLAHDNLDYIMESKNV